MRLVDFIFNLFTLSDGIDTARRAVPLHEYAVACRWCSIELIEEELKLFLGSVVEAANDAETLCGVVLLQQRS